MTTAVIVVDMLRGFLEEGYPLFCGAEARAIIPQVQRLLEEEMARGSKIIYVCDHHAPDNLEFRMFPPHCVRGTPEAEIIPELGAFPGEVVPKTRYSAFYASRLDAVLQAIRPERLIICGVCTDICVLHTTADPRNRDYPVEVPVRAVASFDHEAHEWGLRHMERILGAQLV